MRDEHEIQELQNPNPISDDLTSEPVSVKVYDRPDRPAVPMVVWLSLLVIGLVLAWFVFMAIR